MKKKIRGWKKLRRAFLECAFERYGTTSWSSLGRPYVLSKGVDLYVQWRPNRYNTTSYATYSLREYLNHSNGSCVIDDNDILVYEGMRQMGYPAWLAKRIANAYEDHTLTVRWEVSEDKEQAVVETTTGKYLLVPRTQTYNVNAFYGIPLC